MKKLIAALGCLVTCCALYGQNGWVPPVDLPGTTICDVTRYKLVFFDDFNGTTLSPLWRNYSAFYGMQPAEHENWNGARRNGGSSETNWNSVNRAENVVVSNGTCKLQVKHEPVTWQCASCPPNATRYYSTGFIETPFMIGNTNNADTNFFNSGLFEVRMKMPNYQKAHTTVWLNYSAPGWVNELDMVESWGPTANARSTNTYNLHAWGPGENDPNPYNLPGDASIENTFASYTWFLPLRHKINDWHTYSMRWDTASIQIYEDNVLQNTIWKYYRPRLYYSGLNIYVILVGSGCNPGAGPWLVTYGYPYYRNSNCNFKISTDIRGYQSESVPTNTSTLLGEAEIDYVKIWQRYPELDGRTDLCGHSRITITGPNIVCGSETYVASNTTGVNGIWSVSSYGNALSTDAIINGGSSSSLYVSRNSGSPSESAVIEYKYSLPGCPEQVATKTVDVSTANSAIVSCTRIQQTPTQEQFSFTAIRPQMLTAYPRSSTTYEWDIYYGSNYDCSNQQYYHGFGAFVSTPYFTNAGTLQDYCVSWTLKITNACGTVIKRGQRQFKPQRVRTTYYPELELNGLDTATLYYEAVITDTATYERKVYTRLAQTMISEDESYDTTFVMSTIQRVRLEEIEPYLIWSVDSDKVFTMKANLKMPDSPKTRSARYILIPLTKDFV